MNATEHQLEWACKAIEAYRSKHDDGEAAQLRDLLADLMHWCDTYAVDFDTELSVATDFYGHERAES